MKVTIDIDTHFRTWNHSLEVDEVISQNDDADVGMMIACLDKTWQEIRAGLVPLLEDQSKVPVAILATQEEVNGFLAWRRENG